MKLITIIFLFLFIAHTVQAQHSLRLIVSVPVKTEQVFIAGSFNSWSADDINYKLQRNKSGNYQITIRNLGAGTHHFKFTEGTWATVENNGAGIDIVNRTFSFQKDTTLYLTVKGWMQPVVDPARNGYSVKIVVSGAVYKQEIYLASNVNSWSPRDPRFKFNSLDDYHQQLVVQHVAGQLKFKLTRGSWATVETLRQGSFVDDHVVLPHHDTTVRLTIENWNDAYVDVSKYSDTEKIYIWCIKAINWLDVDTDSAYKYGSYGLQLAESLKDDYRLREPLTIMGRVYAQQGSTYKGIELFYRAIKINKLFNDSLAIASLYNYSGNAFLEQNDTAKAKECYYYSIGFTPKEKYQIFFTGDVVPPLSSLASIYLNENKLDSAEYYIAKAIDVGGANPDWPLLLLGDLAKKRGKSDSALMRYKEAVKKAVFWSDKSPYLAEAFLRLSTIFYTSHDIDSSFYYARKAFVIASEVKDPYVVVSSGNLLIKLFKDEHKLDSAFLYQEKVVQAKDSVFNREKERQLQAAYYNEKIKQQQLAAQNEKVRLQLKGAIIFGVLAVLLLIGLQYHSQLKRNYFKKTAAVEMKALRAQMNPHFIFNCLTSINRYIVKSDNKTASNYLTKFSKLIRLILDNSATEYISLDTEIQTLQLYMDMEALRFDHAFEYEIHTDDAVASENIFIPSMLVQPYAENAIWHGLLLLPDCETSKKERGKLWIRFLKLDQNIIKVEIEDNGVGREKAKQLESKDALKGKSYGMKISKDRIDIINKLQKYNTAVTVQDLIDEAGCASGTKITLTIPINKAQCLKT